MALRAYIISPLASDSALTECQSTGQMMKTKKPYSTLPHVESFIEWLATQLDAKAQLNHTYQDRRTGAMWSCNSLYDAYSAYSWNHPGNERLAYHPGSSSMSNDIALESLRADLNAAGTSDAKMLQATLDVMAWGGVSARNSNWLKENQTGLALMVTSVTAALAKNDPSAPILNSNALRFNSGMTKVYSLLCENFVIYDSRVAAALGMLVVRYCRAKGLETVPAALNFPWAAAKEAANATSPKCRNPSTGTLQFSRLRSGAHHARWNLHASWVLSQSLKHRLSSSSPFHNGKTSAQALRDLEMALFSIGYDLGKLS